MDGWMNEWVDDYDIRSRKSKESMVFCFGVAPHGWSILRV